MKQFFFDTANISYIKDAWTKLESSVDRSKVVGITTNPNAFFKLDKLTLKEWFDLTPKLCEVVSEIRQDDRGVVYIQGPSSKMTADDVLRYAERVAKLTDGNTKVGLKIAPYDHILKIVPQLNEIVDTNVTGVADAGTALKSITYPVRYMSIIPGRMEEVGINAKAQIAFISQCNFGPTEIIAGSMRTLEGLAWTFQYGTVPTIGERVWNQIFEENNLEKVLNIDYSIDTTTTQFCPPIDERNYNLSDAFFKQMDECGKQATLEL
jgi:Transaldolase/Fructose-6-phosphate aldolase